MGVNNRYKGTCSSNAALVNKYVGTAYDHVKTVSDNIEDVKTVAGALGDNFPDEGLDTLVNNIDDIVTNAENISNINIVADIKDEVVTVAGIEQEIIDVPSYTAQAIDAANAAEQYADRAEQEATEAEASNLKAQKWAEEDEDIEVDPGKYSSKHWAAKAEETVLDAATKTWVESGAPEITATGSTTPRRLDDRFADTIRVKDFGGDIQAAINTAPENSIIELFGTGLTMGQVTVSKSLTIVGDMNPITLQGLNAGFLYSGTIANLTFDSLFIQGDGTTTNSHQLCEPAGGVEVDNITIQNCRVQDCPIGISTGFENGRILNHLAVIKNNIVVNVPGTDPGMGYGIHASADHFVNSRGHHIIDGNYIENAERHSIYITRSGRHTVTNNVIKDHRRDVPDILTRAALNVARVSHCVIDGNRFENCRDGNIAIGGENVGGQGYDATNITVSNNTFSNPLRLHCINLSSSTAPDDGTIISDINITGNSFYITDTIPTLAIYQGFNVSVNNNSIQYRGQAGGLDVFLLSPNFETDTTAIKSNFWIIKDNHIQFQGLTVVPDVFRINKRSGVEKYIYDNVIVGSHVVFDASVTLPDEKIWLRGQDINAGLDITSQVQPNPSRTPERVLLRDFPAMITDPNGNTTPNFVGEQVWLSAGDGSIWTGVGLTNTDWVKISN